MCKDLLSLRTKIICIMLKINVLDNKKGICMDVPCLAARQSFIIIVSEYCKHMELTIRKCCRVLFFVRVTIHGSYEFEFLFILFRFPRGALPRGKNSLA